MAKVNDVLKVKAYLAWDVENPDCLSEEAVLERVLNYGGWDDVKFFLKTKGKEQTAQLFKKSLSKKRINYSPEIASYFTRYFRIAN